jgi:hypothetical protein
MWLECLFELDIATSAFNYVEQMREDPKAKLNKFIDMLQLLKLS